MTEAHRTEEEIAAGSAAEFDKMAMYLEKFVLPQIAKLANGDMHHGGITKRELFAAQAMQALLTPIAGDEDPQLWSYAELAKCAVLSADALLKELAK